METQVCEDSKPFALLHSTMSCFHHCLLNVAAAAKLLQLCPTLCDPIDGDQTLPSLGFSRQEHWSGLPFPSPMHESEKWKWSHSVMSDSAIPWTAAHQAPPSMGFSRQEYSSGVPLPSPVFSMNHHCLREKPCFIDPSLPSTSHRSLVHSGLTVNVGWKDE